MQLNAKVVYAVFILVIGVDKSDFLLQSVTTAPTKNVANYFLETIVSRFGENNGLQFENFSKIWDELGLKTNVPQTSDSGHSHGATKDQVINSSQCLSTKDIYHVYNLDTKRSLNASSLLYMCPAVLHQLLMQNCSVWSPQKSPNFLGQKTGYVWLYSSAAVLIISLAGLLGVAVIPIMQKIFYHQLLQFLVALAVGALSGDALLHLFPHAIKGVLTQGKTREMNRDTDHSDLAGMWIGVVALSSIFFFFVMERILTIISRARSKKVVEPTEPVKLKLEPKKSFPEIIETKDLCDSCEKVIAKMMEDNKELVDYAENETPVTAVDGESVGIRSRTNSKEYGLDEKGGHAHGEGHSHGGVPATVKSVAWMVILGDGIHNFSDGLAIGAGFANSIAVGVSTAIAVFCHELPHEIGDFAVLLRSGMKIKQAIVFNCLSSFLCFIGMCVGVSIGNLSTVSLWIFGAVAGMFLYIALVDMMPELTSAHTAHGESQIIQLLLQCCGILTGSMIMFIIAYFEDSLKKLTL